MRAECSNLRPTTVAATCLVVLLLLYCTSAVAQATNERAQCTKGSGLEHGFSIRALIRAQRARLTRWNR